MPITKEQEAPNTEELEKLILAAEKKINGDLTRRNDIRRTHLRSESHRLARMAEKKKRGEFKIKLERSMIGRTISLRSLNLNAELGDFLGEFFPFEDEEDERNHDLSFVNFDKSDLKCLLSIIDEYQNFIELLDEDRTKIRDQLQRLEEPGGSGDGGGGGEGSGGGGEGGGEGGGGEGGGDDVVSSH